MKYFFYMPKTRSPSWLGSRDLAEDASPVGIIPGQATFLGVPCRPAPARSFAQVGFPWSSRAWPPHFIASCGQEPGGGRLSGAGVSAPQQPSGTLGEGRGEAGLPERGLDALLRLPCGWGCPETLVVSKPPQSDDSLFFLVHATGHNLS